MADALEGGAGNGRTRLFPTAEALAAVDPSDLLMPQARAGAVVKLCAALAAGEVVLDRGAERAEVRKRLLELPGIGPWSAEYIAMRALGDPDAYPASDLGVRHGLRRLGLDRPQPTDPSEVWRPWPPYAVMHLWCSVRDRAGA